MERFFVLNAFRFNVLVDTPFLLSIINNRDDHNCYYLDGIKICEDLDAVIRTDTCTYEIDTNSTFEVWLKVDDTFNNSSDLLFEHIVESLKHSEEYKGKTIPLRKIEGVTDAMVS